MDFIKRRVITSLVVFFAALNLDFFLPRLVPGNAAEIFSGGTKLPSNAVKLLEIRFGLNQPLYVQYYLFFKGIFATWPPYFGVSFNYYPETVSNLIAQRLPWTIILIGAAFFLSFYISYILAAFSSMRRGGKFEFGSLYTSILFWSTPAFWIGMILIWVFAISLHWFPVFGNIDFNPGGGLDYLKSVVIHAVLPVVTLTAVVFGQNYFVLRGAAQQALKSDYVLTAKSRGLRNRTIAFGYVLRNSLLPIVSLLGYSLASLLSAVVLVESVFGYTGVGDLIVDAIFNRDYPVLEGTFFYLTVIVIIGGLVGDFVLLKLDPRLRR
jgi:peptide/nickel transport system permease protein